VMELDSSEFDAVGTNASGALPLGTQASPPPIAPPPNTPPPIPVLPALASSYEVGVSQGLPSIPPPRKPPSALGQVVEPHDDALMPRLPARDRKRAMWAAVGAVLASGAAIAGVIAWKQRGSSAAGVKPSSVASAKVEGDHQGDPKRDQPSTTPTASSVPGASSASGARPGSAAPPAPVTGSGSGATTGTGAGSGATTGTASTTGTPTHADSAPPPPHPSSSSSGPSGSGSEKDTLAIVSTPPGASVFLDGADQGKTPVTLPTGRDKHTLVVVKAGFDLFIKEMSGGGEVQVALKEVTPTGGPAGIKVKCKFADRYYIFVDGAGTGQLCPTERIHVTLGPHTVEIYDLVTEQRTQYPVVVKDTEHSLRVKLD